MGPSYNMLMTLISSTNKEYSDKNSILVLNFITDRGYKVSSQKAQIISQQVQYLSYLGTPGAQTLSSKKQWATLALRVPQSKWQLQGFLGKACFCCLCIPGLELIAKSLYKALKGFDKGPMAWIPEYHHVFEKLKVKLSSAPTLGLPNLQKKINPTYSSKTRNSTGSPHQKLGLTSRPELTFQNN